MVSACKGQGDGALTWLIQGWQLCATAPGAVGDAHDSAQLNWSVPVPLGTVASMLQVLGVAATDDAAPTDLDAHDWWFRLAFDAPSDGAQPPPQDAILGLDGLATLAEVWLNGHRLLTSDNMFLAHVCQVGALLEPQSNQLLIVCRALAPALLQKRPRARWRAPMVSHQQLRWVRSSLLGRTPSWTPPVAPVGPWQGVWLVRGRQWDLSDVAMHARTEGDDGVLDFGMTLRSLTPHDAQAQDLTLRLQRNGRTHSIGLAIKPDGHCHGRLRIPSVDRWWPHTHGEPALYECELAISSTQTPEHITVKLGWAGFRSIHIDHSDGDFSVQVNQVPVFCRGANMLPLDPIGLRSDPQRLEADLTLFRNAGMNMLRLPGSMVYGSDALFEACDRLGIMVWQDLMFSNMDYPEDDSAFGAQVMREAKQQMQRLHTHPSLTVVCGNSEVAQQALMFAAPRARWHSKLFEHHLREIAEQTCPGVPYWPSSAHGGAFPCSAHEGTTSYYGVGVYLRPLEDARRSRLRFATECLGFANEPERLGVDVGVIPDDPAIGGNFEQVRDHYLRLLFGVDPEQLKHADRDRYLALSRATSGEVMARTFNEWRSHGSGCRGALVWFWRDIQPGAWFGLIDHQGRPKAPYYHLKRALQSVALSISDEGCSGLDIHVRNERAQPLPCTLDIVAHRADGVVVAQAQRDIDVPSHGSLRLPMMVCFDWFVDFSHAYRFGTAAAQHIRASLYNASGHVIASADHFPAGMSLPVEDEVGLQVTAMVGDTGDITLRLQTERFAQAVHLDLDHHIPDDNHFHLLPGEHRDIAVRPRHGHDGALSGTVRALNCRASYPINTRH